jgi:hypothetical protein
MLDRNALFEVLEAILTQEQAHVPMDEEEAEEQQDSVTDPAAAAPPSLSRTPSASKDAGTVGGNAAAEDPPAHWLWLVCTDIISNMCIHDASLFRSYLISSFHSPRGSHSILHLLFRLLGAPRLSMSVAHQMSCLIRLVLDPEAMSLADQQLFLGRVYEEHLPRLLKPLHFMQPEQPEQNPFGAHSGTTPVAMNPLQLLQQSRERAAREARLERYHVAAYHSIELLSYCALHHTSPVSSSPPDGGSSSSSDLSCSANYFRTFAEQHQVLPIVLSVLRCTRRNDLVCSAIRFFRICVGSKEAAYTESILRHRLFEPIFLHFQHNGPRYNLLNSVVCEMMHYFNLTHMAKTTEAAARAAAAAAAANGQPASVPSLPDNYNPHSIRFLAHLIEEGYFTRFGLDRIRYVKTFEESRALYAEWKKQQAAEATRVMLLRRHPSIQDEEDGLLYGEGGHAGSRNTISRTMHSILSDSSDDEDEDALPPPIAEMPPYSLHHRTAAVASAAAAAAAAVAAQQASLAMQQAAQQERRQRKALKRERRQAKRDGRPHKHLKANSRRRRSSSRDDGESESAEMQMQPARDGPPAHEGERMQATVGGAAAAAPSAHTLEQQPQPLQVAASMPFAQTSVSSPVSSSVASFAATSVEDDSSPNSTPLNYDTSSSSSSSSPLSASDHAAEGDSPNAPSEHEPASVPLVAAGGSDHEANTPYVPRIVFVTSEGDAVKRQPLPNSGSTPTTPTGAAATADMEPITTAAQNILHRRHSAGSKRKLDETNDCSSSSSPPTRSPLLGASSSASPPLHPALSSPSSMATALALSPGKGVHNPFLTLPLSELPATAQRSPELKPTVLSIVAHDAAHAGNKPNSPPRQITTLDLAEDLDVAEAAARQSPLLQPTPVRSLSAATNMSAPLLGPSAAASHSTNASPPVAHSIFTPSALLSPSVTASALVAGSSAAAAAATGPTTLLGVLSASNCLTHSPPLTPQQAQQQLHSPNQQPPSLSPSAAKRRKIEQQPMPAH